MSCQQFRNGPLATLLCLLVSLTLVFSSVACQPRQNVAETESNRPSLRERLTTAAMVLSAVSFLAVAQVSPEQQPGALKVLLNQPEDVFEMESAEQVQGFLAGLSYARDTSVLNTSLVVSEFEGDDWTFILWDTSQNQAIGLLRAAPVERGNIALRFYHRLSTGKVEKQNTFLIPRDQFAKLLSNEGSPLQTPMDALPFGAKAFTLSFDSSAETVTGTFVFQDGQKSSSETKLDFIADAKDLAALQNEMKNTPDGLATPLSIGQRATKAVESLTQREASLLGFLTTAFVALSLRLGALARRQGNAPRPAQDDVQ